MAAILRRRQPILSVAAQPSPANQHSSRVIRQDLFAFPVMVPWAALGTSNMHVWPRNVQSYQGICTQQRRGLVHKSSKYVADVFSVPMRSCLMKSSAIPR